jgi:hypothetical protein
MGAVEVGPEMLQADDLDVALCHHSGEATAVVFDHTLMSLS